MSHTQDEVDLSIILSQVNQVHGGRTHIKTLSQKHARKTELFALDANCGPENFVIVKTGPYSADREALFLKLQHRQEKCENQRLAHMPRILEVKHLDSELELVFEYIEGSNLVAYMEENWENSSDLEKLKFSYLMFSHIAEALDFLHSQDKPIIHRDIKPENVIVQETEDGPVFYLIDLGISREYKENQPHDTELFGTRSWAPPEQYGFGQTSTKSDIYALGLLIYYSLTFDGDPHLNASRPFEKLQPFGNSFEELVIKATKFDPQMRFDSIAELRTKYYEAYFDFLSEWTAKLKRAEVEAKHEVAATTHKRRFSLTALRERCISNVKDGIAAIDSLPKKVYVSFLICMLLILAIGSFIYVIQYSYDLGSAITNISIFYLFLIPQFSYSCYLISADFFRQKKMGRKVLLILPIMILKYMLVTIALLYLMALVPLILTAPFGIKVFVN